MKKFFIAFLLFLVLAFIASLFHYFYGESHCGVCANKDKQEQIIPEQTTTVVKKLSEFVITDAQGKTVFKFPSNFVIDANTGQVEIPTESSGFRDSIYNYLNKNQGKELLISAKYTSAEGESRGIDRADFLKNILVNEAKINPARIIPTAVLSDFSYDESDKYSEGISMLFRNSSDETKSAIDARITNKILYSKFGATDFKPDHSLQAYALELKNYLKNKPSMKVLITGHTDNVGGSASNYHFGMKRAKNVMNYLISQGIDKQKLSAFSKGETDPIATNETEEGKAQNRRITITVQ
jgi:outer membrane protein OmpA-like peptidoglycan-associated protein